MKSASGMENNGPMPSFATMLITLMLAVPAMPVELFR
jgi:hypothetical protein